ncbi:MAG: hypothetical protein WCG23_06985 [bacterium]
MSLVSSVMADMQYSMMASDCEDKAANIAAKLKSVTEQGSELGKMLSNIENQIDMAKYSFRELESYAWTASNSQNPQAQQVMGMVNQRKSYCQQVFSSLQQRKVQLEAEKKRFAAQEKELTAQQTQNDVMKKFADAASQKFKGFIDGAIKRFFGGGGGQ